MTTSHPMSKLSRPVEGQKIPDVTRSYIKARNRRRAFNTIKDAFLQGDVSRTELAFRTGKGRDQISRLLGQPSNVTIDTMAELIFAICGCELYYELVNPSQDLQRKTEISDAQMVGPISTKASPVSQEGAPETSGKNLLIWRTPGALDVSGIHFRSAA
jgi:hypothetical protein